MIELLTSQRRCRILKRERTSRQVPRMVFPSFSISIDMRLLSELCQILVELETVIVSAFQWKEEKRKEKKHIIDLFGMIGSADLSFHPTLEIDDDTNFDMVSLLKELAKQTDSRFFFWSVSGGDLHDFWHEMKARIRSITDNIKLQLQSLPTTADVLHGASLNTLICTYQI